MKVVKVKIESLFLDPGNVRKHDQKNLDAIKGSLKKFGQQKPLVINKDNIIIAGNGTYQAAKALGWTEIEVVKTELEGIDQVAFAIADNRTSDMSEFDEEALAQIVKELNDSDFNIADIGFEIPNDEISESNNNLDLEGKKEFLIVVECVDEQQQSDLFEKFQAEGLICKLM